MNRLRRARCDRRLVCMALLATVAGCAAPPPPPPPTVVHVTMNAAPDANPAASGQGAPVALRVYQLGSKAGFNGAEFYPLYNTDAATLGSDLVKRDDFILAPGQTQSITISPRDDVTAIGVFAGYRDFQNATWRATADIPPHQVTNVTVTAGRSGISIKAESLPPAKAGS